MEIERFHEFFKEHSFTPIVKEIQIGGGSPSYMTDEEFNFLMEKIKLLVNPLELEEFAFEIDPRSIDPKRIEMYKSAGVNRISLGIQDFDPHVQKAVNRIQPRELVETFLTPEVKKGLKGVNIDLLYGLPLQSIDSFRKTIQTAIDISPERITLLKYAHTPEREICQRALEKYPFPDYIEKMRIFKEALDKFQEAGYVHVGINDFVKANDDLAIALGNKTLHRIFNGFSPGRAKNLIAIGPSSTSSFQGYYFQNVYLGDYPSQLSKSRFPILKGYKLTQDDLIRREVINALLCERFIDISKIEEKYEINFREYFNNEIERLKPFIEDELIEVSEDKIKITPLGKMFVPHISSRFDNFLVNKEYKVSGP
jgi:oxygen-independent coproporphyrinogen-3 oxidase